MTLTELNGLTYEEALTAFFSICSSPNWAVAMAMARPYGSMAEVRERAQATWAVADEGDWLAAFAGHPKIGDAAALREKFGHTAREQGQVGAASDEVLERLRAGNVAYEVKFGFIFIVCAKGKTAEHMLDLLETRLGNSRAQELGIAAGEQGKIIQLRLGEWSDV